MLLPFECLAYTIVDGRLLPTWLGEADEPFVAAIPWPRSPASRSEKRSSWRQARSRG